MKRGVVTRRFYRFEDRLAEDYFAERAFWAERSMAQLQRLTRRVWRAERCNGPVPVVVAGRGTPGCGGLVSYCEAERPGGDEGYGPWQYRIVLSRPQRNVEVLLHELAHAMVPHAKYVHGPAFTRMFLYLMMTYARVGVELMIAAEQEGVL